MTIAKDKGSLSIFTAAIAVLSLILVGLGGYVRGTGAGLSCPDWPLCYGRAVPKDFGNGVFQEVVHRYIASAVSLLTLIFSFLAFRRRREHPRLWGIAVFGISVLFLQVVLGGLTVLMKLNPFIVTGHLALGTLFFQTFAFIAADLSFSRTGIGEALGTSRRALSLLAGLTFLQLLIGGFVGSSGAAMACPDLPICSVSAASALGDNHQQNLHMLHRCFAVFLFSAVILIAVRELLSHTSKSRLWMLAASVLISLQIALGLMNVYFRVPVHVAVSHLIVGELTLFALLQAWRVKASYPIFLSTAADGRTQRSLRFQEARSA